MQLRNEGRNYANLSDKCNIQKHKLLWSDKIRKQYSDVIGMGLTLDSCKISMKNERSIKDR